MTHETESGGDIRHAFADFEASALGPGSYPIEIAWGWVDTFEIESYLIKPTDEWLESGHWDEVAEAEIHKLSRAQLLKDGVPVETVAERMIAVLAGNAAYSDGPRFDGEWLHKLFQAAGRRQPVEIESIDVLLRARFDIEVAWAAEEEAKKTCPPTHRAGDDVRHLLEIYRLAAAATRQA